MVESYPPGGANLSSCQGTLVPPGEYNWTCADFGQPESTTQMANWSVQPILQSSHQKVPILFNGRLCPPKLPLPMRGSGVWTPI